MNTNVVNPIPDCDQALLNQADFDGELDAAEAAAIARHRHGCEVCRTAYAALERSRLAVREGATRYTAPDALRRAVLERLAAAEPAKPEAQIVRFPGAAQRRRATWWQPLTSFGAGIAVAATVLLTVLTPGSNELLNEVVSDHVRALQPGHTIDVVSTDQHTVKPWFDGRLDFAPPVKDLAAQRFPLEGGRLDYLDGRPVAALVYKRDKHIINLYVWPAASAADQAPTMSQRNGYNVVHWVKDHMTLWAVSDLEADQLREFSQLWGAST